MWFKKGPRIPRSYEFWPWLKVRSPTSCMLIVYKHIVFQWFDVPVVGFCGGTKHQMWRPTVGFCVEMDLHPDPVPFQGWRYLAWCSGQLFSLALKIWAKNPIVGLKEKHHKLLSYSCQSFPWKEKVKERSSKNSHLKTGHLKNSR